MVKRLFLDTNIFLSFFHSSKDDLDEMAKVVKLICDEEIELFSNDQLRREISRNRESKIALGFKELKSANFGMEFPHYCSNYSEFEEIRGHLRSANQLHKALVQKISADIKAKTLKADTLIKDLLGLSKDLPMKKSTLRRARFRLETGDPPGKRNSIGDAIHWQCLLDHAGNGDIDIVSLDGDFSSKLNPQNISDFLFEEWKNSKQSGEVTLFNSLTSFFKARFPDINLSTEFEKDELAQRLANSPNFSMTHEVIEKLMEHEHFTKGQIRQLFDALLKNSQVRMIATDPDIREFFTKFLSSAGHLDFSALEKAEDVLEIEEGSFIPF